MKRLIVFALALASALQLHAKDLTKVTFTPQWTPQTQFAGYYVAKDKGFFEEEGLDVSISHIGMNSTESMASMLVSDRCQFLGMQLVQSIVFRSDGLPVVNVMQLTQHTGLMCVAHRPLNSVSDLSGLKIGRWRQGFSEICDILLQRGNVYADWVPFINGINLFVFGAVDATLCYSYSEYVNLELSTGKVPEENVLRFSEHGIDPPEDGVYVTDKYLKNNPETVAAFVRASKRGWDYAREHREEAVEITMRYVKEANVVTNKLFQSRMLDEFLALQLRDGEKSASYERVSPEMFGILSDALYNSGMIVRKPEYEEVVK